jgi:hypothetical protein
LLGDTPPITNPPDVRANRLKDRFRTDHGKVGSSGAILQTWPISRFPLDSRSTMASTPARHPEQPHRFRLKSAKREHR